MRKTMVSHPHAKVIVNPAAGSGSTGKEWPRIHRALRHSGLSFDRVHTKGRGHATELAMEASQKGYECVVAVGGDGTLNEIVNGLMASDNFSDVTLGILSTGTCCDFARFLGMPRDFRKACSRLVNHHKIKIDVGIVEFRCGGQPQSRFFIGIASMGFDAKVVQTAFRIQMPVGGIMPFIFAMVYSLGIYKNKNICLQLGVERKNIRAFSVVIANTGFYGGGIHMAPQADIQDGLFDIVVVGGIGKLAFLKGLRSAVRGSHGTHPKVQMNKAAQVTIQSAEQVLLQADGEFFGEAPASFRVLPSALTVAI